MRSDRMPFSAALGAALIALAPAAVALVNHGSRAERATAATAAAKPVPIDGDAIAADVARLRELQFEDVPPVRSIGPKQERQLTHRLSREQRQKAKAKATPKQRRQAREIARGARAGLDWAQLVGFLDPGFKLSSATQALGSSVVGEYQPSEHAVYVQRSGVDPNHSQDVIVAHELDHALDSQHFPKLFHVKQTPNNSERANAVQALVEGTATVVSERYAHEHGYPSVGPGRQLYSVANLGFGVPAGLAAEFRFPYTAGADFVRYLLRRGGWKLVDQAWRNPPTSTAQILDPSRWLRRTGYESLSIPAALGPPWKLLGTSDSGALDAQVLLSLGMQLGLAKRSSEGWDGGEIATWRQGAAKCPGACRSRTASVAAYRWTSPLHAARFTTALPIYIATRLRAQPAGHLTWKTGDGYIAIGSQGVGTAIGLAPTAGLARHLAGVGVQAANLPK